MLVSRQWFLVLYLFCHLTGDSVHQKCQNVVLEESCRILSTYVNMIEGVGVVGICLTTTMEQPSVLEN